MIIYIINGEIEFRPDENKLVSLVNLNLSTTLTTPSSKCLSLLLESAPELVSHEELLNRVWRDNGMLVPLNTLHQNISIIRRGFNQVQSTDNKIIKNIPGKGFKILSRVDVVGGKKSLSDHTREDHSIMNHQDDEVISNKSKQFYKWRGWLFLSMALVLLVLSFSFGFGRKDVYHGYNLKTTNDNCHIYSNARVKYDFDKVSEIQSKLLMSGFSCEDYSWWYITTYKASSVSSAVVCKEDIKNKIKDNCVSFYFRDELEK